MKPGHCNEEMTPQRDAFPVSPARPELAAKRATQIFGHGFHVLVLGNFSPSSRHTV